MLAFKEKKFRKVASFDSGFGIKANSTITTTVVIIVATFITFTAITQTKLFVSHALNFFVVIQDFFSH